MSIMERVIRHFHFYCGAGGGAKGANKAKAEVGMMRGKFRCIGGIDSDAAAVRDFTRMAGVQGTCLDLFSLDQYRRFHGCEPPAGWREATRDDIHKAAGYERPHVLLMSPPCKGFSGLLSEKLSQSTKYQALNELALRGLHLALDAWGDDPAEFILVENVPRIQTRGRHLLDQFEQLLSHYDYASAETTHDCGEIGKLGQSRKRFLLVARHVKKVPPFLYEPVKHPLRAVGRILEDLPMPGDVERAGPMHRIPSLQWKTWVRLAFVEAGSDWRSLSKLKIQDGYLKDFAITPERPAFNDAYGVRAWDQSSQTITGDARPSKGAFSVADPRISQSAEYSQLGVRRWSETTGAVSGQSTVGGGTYAVADPRVGYGPNSQCNKLLVTDWERNAKTVTGANQVQRGALAVADPRMPREKPFANVFRVVRWDDVSRAVTGGGHPTSGGIAVADPRTAGTVFSGYGVTHWDESARTIAGESFPSNGAFAVADPRSGIAKQKGDDYLSSGHYGVVPWEKAAGAVTASLRHDSGPGNVADPRLPEPNDKVTAVIRSLDDCWHRPFTTFELAALQGLIDPGERFEMDGQSDGAWRERIGNAIPAPAAEAIFGVIGTTLLLAWTGETFVLGSTPIWVRDIAVALSVARQAQ